MADLYSRNAIVNPGAESGDTSGWDVAINITAESGGYSGSYCFLTTPNASMYQQFTVGTAPPDYLASVAYLPAYDPPDDTSAKAELEVLLSYASSYLQVSKIPLRAEAPAGGV